MKINRFWVVTTPTEVSELGDIVFPTHLGRKHPKLTGDVYDLANQFRGGLGFDEIVAIFTTEEEANWLGNKLLEEKKGE